MTLEQQTGLTEAKQDVSKEEAPSPQPQREIIEARGKPEREEGPGDGEAQITRPSANLVHLSTMLFFLTPQCGLLPFLLSSVTRIPSFAYRLHLSLYSLSVNCSLILSFV